MAALIRSFDWASTPLGPIEGWPTRLKTVAGLLAPSAAPMVLLWGPDGVMSHPAIRFPNRYRCKDGGHRWISWVGAPEEGTVYCSGRDITDEKAAEANLLDERGVSALREQFIAVLGHDLRNPLSAVASGMRLSRRTAPDEKAKSVVTLTESSVKRMVELVDDVTDFARGRLGGGLPLEHDPAQSIMPVLQQVVSELQTSHPDRSIATMFASNEPVRVDRRRIGQLVSNLVGNAIRHGAPDQQIRVKAAAAGGSLEISVSNSGAPSPAPVLERIFRPFTRGEVRPNSQGLGLASTSRTKSQSRMAAR